MTEIAGWPAWSVMLAEIVVGIHDGRIAQGREAGRNITEAVAAIPPGLLDIARQQNATRAARNERPAAGPRMTGSVPELRERPRGYPGPTSRTRQSVGDHVRDQQGRQRR